MSARTLPSSPVRLRSGDYHQLVSELRHPSPGVTTLVTLSGGPAPALHGAAQQVARDLGRSVLRIDLGSLSSKYIGETEKNIHRVFAQAAQSNAVLLFDEADALFGRRTDVKDSHDRYATTVVDRVRRSLEGYPGVAIVVSAAGSPPATSTPPGGGHTKVRRVALTWPPA